MIVVWRRVVRKWGPLWGGWPYGPQSWVVWAQYGHNMGLAGGRDGSVMGGLPLMSQNQNFLGAVYVCGPTYVCGPLVCGMGGLWVVLEMHPCVAHRCMIWACYGPA